MRLILFFLFIFCLFEGYAQQTPSEIKYKTWDIHALHYYPLKQPADSFMKQIIERKKIPLGDTFINQYEKTTMDLAMSKSFFTDKMSRTILSQNLFYKYVLSPYKAWINYARPIREDSTYLNLTLFLSERYSKENKQMSFLAQSPLEWIGTENIRYGLDEWIGKVDLWTGQNETVFLFFKNPVAKGAEKFYHYYFSSQTEIEGIPVYEIAFLSQKRKEKAFEGYLYISVSDSSLVKAIFTLNQSVNKEPANSVLFIQTPFKKETKISVGSEQTAGLLIERLQVRENNPADSATPEFRVPAEKVSILTNLAEEARHTSAFSNVQKGLSFLLTGKIGIFNSNFDLGPISQMLSYNYMEGVRLRIGGTTSEKICKQAVVGGYLAYGTEDHRWKYRGDIIYTPRKGDQLQLTYVNDFNIPGQDCLEDIRDRIYYSLSQINASNMSFQKIGQLSYKTEQFRPFSLHLNAKYMYDQPLGIVDYEMLKSGGYTAVNSITTTELGVSFRFAPNEKYIFIKGKRIVFHSPDIDFRLNYRIGIKGIFGSGFDYHITDASLFKSFELPCDIGIAGIRFSGGKIWNSVPFPLLFIPAGNQSYIYESNKYNLMRFYEFTTDRYVAGSADFQFNWSPINLISPKSAIKTCAGIKAIYGPLSGINNPQRHPELFVFNHGVEALGEKPYTEAHIGLSGILTYFRIDYAYRLTYGNRGSLFVSTVFNF